MTQRKQIQFLPQKGMNKDLSISKFSPEFIYDGYNIRLNSYEEGTMFTLTNEKGNLRPTLYNEDLGGTMNIEGTAIGYAVLNDYLVLFTTTRDTTTELSGLENPLAGTDRIYRITKREDFNNPSVFNLSIKLLYQGTDIDSLNFSKENLIETIAIFESENLQKVYWVDGKNQSRFINIVDSKIGSFNRESFNFSQKLQLNESVSVTKTYTGGQFHSGTIQYALSYWNKNGVESNIFYVTPLYYISFIDRAGSPEEVCSNTFRISVSNVDRNFDYLRVYAIHRTTQDAVPNVRIVSDFNIQSNEYASASITDNGIIGSTFSPDALNFIGGDELIIDTITHKDNALFGGNIKLKTPSIETIQEELLLNPVLVEVRQGTKTVSSTNGLDISKVYNYYPYTLDSSSGANIKHWKKGETYRFGFQLQYKNGKWSDPIWTGKDTEITLGYKVLPSSGQNPTQVNITYTYCTLSLSTELSNKLKDLGFKKVRPIYVPLTVGNRKVASQGFLNGTLAKIGARDKNSPYAYADYYMRTNREFVKNLTVEQDDLIDERDEFSYNYSEWSGAMITTPFTNLAPSQASGDYNNLFVNVPNSIYRLLHPAYSTNPEDYVRIFNYSEILSNNKFAITNNNSPNLDGWITPNDESFRDYENVWFTDNNLVSFFSPETQYDWITDVDLSTVKQIKFRGLANITNSSISYSHTTADNVSNGRSVQYYPLHPAADWEILHMVSSRGILASGTGKIIPWTAKKVTSTNATTEFLSKKSSKYNISFYNDMLVQDFTMNINSPKYIHRTDVVNSYKVEQDIFGGSITYNSKVEEISVNEQAEAASIIYDTNNHLVMSLKESKLLPSFWQSDDNNIVNDKFKLWYKDTPYYTNYLFSQTYLGKSYSTKSSEWTATDGTYRKSGYPYVWIVDLIRDVENQYGGNTLETIVNNNWIPCGLPVRIGNSTSSTTYIQYTEGDTFIQRYDCLRDCPKTAEVTGEAGQWQRYTNGVSLWIESFINLDGRYDSLRYDLDLTNLSFENFNMNNPVYSQLNNFFNYNMLNYELLNNDHLPTSFLWSEPKIYGETIDTWTSLWLSNSYTLDGSLGTVRALRSFKNELYGFQDKGIFQIIYNPRVQVNASDGAPIEITQSGKMQGVRYLSDTIGTSNKWSIIKSNKGLYFIDTFNKDIYLLNNPPLNMSEQLGLKTWAYNNFNNFNTFDLVNNKNAFSVNVDLLNDNIYFNNLNSSLMMSERLSQFESFYSYEGIPFMFNIWGEFIALTDEKDSTLWINHKGDYNSFFGKDKPSTVEFYANPEMPLDKVFDNFQYRTDIFDKVNDYLPKETFDSFSVSSEYQDGYLNLKLNNPDFRQKKFRIWSFPFPRQSGSLNRIRNPWVKMKFNWNNPKHYKLAFHDLVVSYTV